MPTSHPTSKVSRIEFGMIKSDEMIRLSHLQVINRSMYQLDRQEPMPFGCLDRKLGTSQKKGSCLTCFKGIQECIGHFGHIKF